MKRVAVLIVYIIMVFTAVYSQDFPALIGGSLLGNTDSETEDLLSRLNEKNKAIALAPQNADLYIVEYV
jgi:hypothetical protein